MPSIIKCNNTNHKVQELTRKQLHMKKKEKALTQYLFGPRSLPAADNKPKKLICAFDY